MNGVSVANSAAALAVGGSTGFLSFNSHPPRVYVTAEDDDFDETTLQDWRDEGEVVPRCLSTMRLTSCRLCCFLLAHGQRGKGV
jgi:hypothetical protein